MRHRFVVVNLPCDDGDFTFHLVVDENNKAAKMRLGGWWGKPRTHDSMPFVLLPDGKIDFGASPDDAIEVIIDRFGNTDLMNREIFIGREVEISTDAVTHYSLKISSVEEIVGCGPSAKLPA